MVIHDLDLHQISNRQSARLSVSNLRCFPLARPCPYMESSTQTVVNGLKALARGLAEIAAKRSIETTPASRPTKGNFDGISSTSQFESGTMSEQSVLTLPHTFRGGYQLVTWRGPMACHAISDSSSFLPVSGSVHGGAEESRTCSYIETINCIGIVIH